MKRLNPYRITNISLAGLILWRIVLALYKFPTDGIEITGAKLIVFLIGAVIFHMSMTPIAEYFTGQKTISCFGTVGFVQTSRHDVFGMISQFFLSFFGVFGGVAGIMTS